MMKKVNLLFLFFAFISFEIYSQGLKLEPNKYKAYETYTTNVSIKYKTLHYLNQHQNFELIAKILNQP